MLQVILRQEDENRRPGLGPWRRIRTERGAVVRSQDSSTVMETDEFPTTCKSHQYSCLIQQEDPELGIWRQSTRCVCVALGLAGEFTSETEGRKMTRI